MKKGTVIKLKGELLEIVDIIPHQENKGSVYYKLSNGLIERDCRLHPDAIYDKSVPAQTHNSESTPCESQEWHDLQG